MPLDLVADQVGQGVTDRAIKFADDDLWLGAEVVRVPFDKSLAGPQDNSFAHRPVPRRLATSSMDNQIASD